MTATSYDPHRTVAGGLAAELARLDAQAELSFAEELGVFRSLGLDAAASLLEIGAGSGAVTRRLRAAVPWLALTALDRDASLLAHLDATGVETVVADAHDLPLPDAGFDAVLLRYVLQHVATPARVLSEAVRVLRPGGLLLVVEVDGALPGLVEPYFPEVVPIYARVSTVQSAAGGDRLIGRRLTRLLRGAGCDDVVLRPYAITSDERPIEAFAPHLGPDRLSPLVASGALTLAEFALATDRWRRLRADPNAWLMLLGFVAAGRRPNPGG
ncbi:MAG TPA: methyltransferase domain-containing protein [Jatrophihabitantaceae bacterium]|jgi:SAM-dependent methyltransferase